MPQRSRRARAGISQRDSEFFCSPTKLLDQLVHVLGSAAFVQQSDHTDHWHCGIFATTAT
jgi:hypothetical protein